MSRLVFISLPSSAVSACSVASSAVSAAFGASRLANVSIGALSRTLAPLRPCRRRLFLGRRPRARLSTLCHARLNHGDDAARYLSTQRVCNVSDFPHAATLTAPSPLSSSSPSSPSPWPLLPSIRQLGQCRLGAGDIRVAPRSWTRSFSSPSSPSVGGGGRRKDDDDVKGEKDDSIKDAIALDPHEKEAEKRRVRSILVNPASQSSRILPGGRCVIKTDPKTGHDRKVYAERALGYFWTLRDLKDCNNKPILSNGTIIDSSVASRFPTLIGCRTLLDDKDGGGIVDLPEYFCRNNRSRDATAQCTLVGISFKEFGYKMLSSWLDPFRDALCSSDDDGHDNDDPTLRGRYSIATLSVNEGRALSFLSGWVVRSARSNVPNNRHSESLIYFGDASDFRDALRMHNTLTGYVYLVDGIGRVRWAGSGKGTDEEVNDLVRFASELAPSRGGRRQAEKSRRGGGEEEAEEEGALPRSSGEGARRGGRGGVSGKIYTRRVRVRGEGGEGDTF